jgi:2-keto-4-pentenoate hydratase/2-oxohepta-3-ene-1,7-dioic acid hydratase in catechol pathway
MDHRDGSVGWEHVVKFARFELPGRSPALGVADGEVLRVVDDYDDLLPLLRSGIDSLHEMGAEALRRGTAVPLAEVRLLSPLECPSTFRDFYAFEDHVRAGRAWRGLEMDPDWYELPVFYFSNPYVFKGPGDIAMTPGTTQFDFELEVAAVLAGSGSDLTLEQAESLVAGYCVLNDWSARDIQQREMKLSLGPVKGKDSATGLGPFFVTKDELDDVRDGKGYRLRMTCEVNGVRYSDALWSDVYFSFGEMVAYASRGSAVRAGDVIGSGTCGTGCILELSRSADGGRFDWLRPGDVVSASVERLGTLTNTIIGATAATHASPE